MRALAILLALFTVLSPVSAQDLGPQTTLPDYIRYQRPSSAEEQAAVARVKLIMNSRDQDLPIILAGPFLNQWLQLDAVPGSVPSSYIIPRVEGFLRGSGAMLKEPDGRKVFQEKIATDHQIAIRRPTLAEYEYLWAIAPSDLQGPILVTEADEHKVLWNFLDEDVLYIEDVTAAVGTLEETYEAFANLPQTALESEPLPDFVSQIVQGGEVPELLKEASSCTRPLIVFLTSDESVQTRVKADPLLTYVQGLKNVLAQTLAAQGSERLYLQFDLRPGEETLLYAGAKPALSEQAQEALLGNLRALATPPVKGPVRMFFVELPAGAENQD